MGPIELHPGIVSDADILGGKPVIRGTRVPVDLVLGQLASGMTADEVACEYGLTLDDLHAAFGYAAQRVAEEAILVTGR
jgi:uncharacterized protein (DUF433 family)